MRVARSLLLVFLALGPNLAHAAITVETVPLLTREAADALLASAQEALPAAARLRVARRYVRGLGWRHFVIAEGITERRQGAVLAAALAVEGEPAAVLGEADPPALSGPRPSVPPSSSVSPSDPAPVSAPAAESQRLRSRSAAVVVRAAARAHSKETDIRARIEGADRVAFQFVRTLPDKGPLVARHSYTRSGAARRLDVVITAGEGTGSSAGVALDGTGWLQEAGGEVLERDAARLTEVVDRFSPSAVLSAGLDLGLELSSGTAWQGLERVGETGGSVVVLRPQGAVEPGGVVEAVFDASSHRLQEVTWQRGAGRITFVYGDIADLGDGLVIPRRMSVRQQERTLEEIIVESLVVNGKVGAGRFSRPEK